MFQTEPYLRLCRRGPPYTWEVVVPSLGCCQFRRSGSSVSWMCFFRLLAGITDEIHVAPAHRVGEGLGLAPVTMSIPVSHFFTLFPRSIRMSTSSFNLAIRSLGNSPTVFEWTWSGNKVLT